MIIYESDKAQFMKYVEKRIISDVVYDYYSKKVGNIKASEILAWRNSLRNMYSVLNTDAIPNNAGIAIEYMLPYQYSRIDFIVTGKDNFNSDHVIIIELKQWTEAKAISDKHLVETYVGGGNRELIHPSYQAWSYAETLKEYNKTRGYSLIFSNTGFDNLLYADSAFNITKEIVDGLNARYSSAKK